MEFPRVGIITIQGGGAVAIDLIGQLQGLTGPPTDEVGQPTGDRGLLPAAIAGTSAGAIIATLYWAGYSPDAIRNEVVTLFAPNKVNRFFGRGGRLLPIRFKGFAAVADAATAFSRGPLAFLMHLLWPGWRWWWWLLIPFWWIWQAISLPYRSFATLSALYRHRGIFPGDGMVQEIDRLLRSSPLLSPHKHQLPETGLLRFYDVAQLQDPRTMPLFLIVTDVQSADIIAVSSIDPTYADFPIALAARASGGFPGFFQPERLSNRFSTCIDGGVISNFPAWVFGIDYRKSLRESGDSHLAELAHVPWVHVGLRLPPGPAPDPIGFDGFLRALMGLLTGGGRARLDDKLATVMPKRRAVNPTPAPRDAAPNGVLDFNSLSDPALVESAFRRGRINGQQAIEADCFTLPEDDEIKPILSSIADRAAFLLRDWMVPASPIRTNIFIPQDEELVLAYQVNMNGDPDQSILLSRGRGITSLVYFRRVTVVADLRGRTLAGGVAPAGSDLYLTSEGAPAIRQDRTWLLSMPLVDITEMWPRSSGPTASSAVLSLDMEGPILGVLNVDAAINYELADAPAPNRATNHPAVLALFDVMKSAAMQCSFVLNRRFVR